MNQDMTNWLENRAEISPNKVAIEFNDEQLTYSELYSQAKEYASWIKSKYQGMNRVALFLDNSLKTIIAIHAIIITDIELVIINSRLTASEIEYQLDYLDVDLIISVKSKLDTLNELSFSSITFMDEEFSLSAEMYDFEKRSPNDILCYVFTSGTTGKPKAVPLTYSNFYFSAISSAIKLGVEDHDHWLMVMPMYHLGGLSIIFRTCLYGTTIICHSGFDEDKIIQDLSKNKITQISLVPTMLRRLLKRIDEPYNLRFVLVGGGKTPEHLINEAIQKGIPISTTYGMTETCSQIITATPGEVMRKPYSVGKPLFHASIKVYRPDIDGIGEIMVKGPMVMESYFNQQTPTEGEYFLTGDIGFIDGDGDVTILQRRQDLIISGGENIYPSEIELVLEEMDEIDIACVIGKDDEEWGQIPVTFLKLNKKINKNEIRNHLASRLAKYKIPKFYYEVQNFPLTSSGKIKRKELGETSVNSSTIIN